MQRLPVSISAPGIVSVVLGLLIAGSAITWSSMALRAEAYQLPALTSTASDHSDLKLLARALGAAEGNDRQDTSTPSNISVSGVVAGRAHHSAALLSVDGQAPKAFLLGQTVVDSWKLQSVSEEHVVLSDDTQTKTLPIPRASRGKDMD